MQLSAYHLLQQRLEGADTVLSSLIETKRSQPDAGRATINRSSGPGAAGQATSQPNCPVPGDHSAVEPPVPIPNTEVKRRSANGSLTKGHARVGRCQVMSPHCESSAGSLRFYRLLATSRTHLHHNYGRNGGRLSSPGVSMLRLVNFASNGCDRCD